MNIEPVVGEETYAKWNTYAKKDNSDNKIKFLFTFGVQNNINVLKLEPVST